MIAPRPPREIAAGFAFGERLSYQTMHRAEIAEHPFVSQAKQLAREAGSTDNATINWALKMLEDSLAFGNRGHGRSR